MYKKKCKICGKEFETNYRRKSCCSEKCAEINKREITRQWNKLHAADYRRAKRKGISVVCRICGEPIYRDINKRSTAVMHDECVFRQCAEVLTKGERLTTAQIQRLYARGYTKKEFIEEYMNGE